MPRKKEIEIVLDTETTGLDYTRERIIEFAAVRLENGKIKDEFQTLINPHQHIRKSSQAVHGITQEMVEDAPSEEEALPKILEFIGDYPIVAHNVIFDDSQAMFKEIAPDLESHGLEALTKRFNVDLTNHHRAMADTMGLALAYPKLKKLYLQRLDWQKKQLGNVDYLFDRYLRIQQSIATMQAELQDLKSVFKLHFELGGEPLVAETGEMMVYQSKQSFGYDLADIKDVLENVGALEKAVKVNNGFIDRLCNGLSLSEEYKEIIRDARQELSETRNIQVIKPCKQ